MIREWCGLWGLTIQLILVFYQLLLCCQGMVWLMGANNLDDFEGFISSCCVVRGLCGCFGLTIWLILGVYQLLLCCQGVVWLFWANNLADFGGFISFCCVVRGWCGCFGLTIWLILGFYQLNPHFGRSEINIIPLYGSSWLASAPYFT